MGYHKEDSKEPLILEKDEVDSEDWKVISALFSIPEDAVRIVITYTKVEYFVEDAA